MVSIIDFEGADYSGKSTTIQYLAKKLSKVRERDFAFNEGPIYPKGLTARLLAIANQTNSSEREFLYTSIFTMDKTESITHYANDSRFFFQDRYWPSVIAYGKFLNGDKSIHCHQNFRPFFIQPAAIIHLSCSFEEKIRRSLQRDRKSIFDVELLKKKDALDRLEKAIDESLQGLPNVIKIDTTNKPVKEVAKEVGNYLRSAGIVEI